MQFPVTLKKKEDSDGKPFWTAEQKQLELYATEYELEKCLSQMRDKIKKAFQTFGCNDDKFARLQLDLVAARAEVVVDIKINRSLDEFTEPVESLDDRELECDPGAVPELEGGMAALPEAEDVPKDWIPKYGDAVIYKKPSFAEECGVFIVVDEGDLTDSAEVLIVPIDDENEEGSHLEYLDALAPSQIGKEQMNICKDFKKYQEQQYLNSIPVTKEAGGVADDL